MKQAPSPTTSKATFPEPHLESVPREIPLSHLSIEVGHFYMSDLAAGPERLRRQFERIAPWARTAETVAAAQFPAARTSTCFLVDDYFQTGFGPGDVVGLVLRLAEEAGVRIDYLVREAGCAASADGTIRPVELVTARLSPEPPPGTNGSRPPARDSGWLTNGTRGADQRPREAMRARSWSPPEEFGAREHSIFLDVELWRDLDDRSRGARGGERLWSCPMLAAVWQLLRLGVLRDVHGGEVAPPVEPGPEWPASWDEMDIVTRVNPKAKPFAAYRSVSILPETFLPVERAVRLIMEHVDLDREVVAALAARARREGVPLPEETPDRLTHVFVEK